MSLVKRGEARAEDWKVIVAVIRKEKARTII
jgi:hypothetical protein